LDTRLDLELKREGRSGVFTSERGANTPKSEHEHELHQLEHEHSPSRFALCKAGGKFEALRHLISKHMCNIA
jgi:hypothetical protein